MPVLLSSVTAPRWTQFPALSGPGTTGTHGSAAAHPAPWPLARGPLDPIDSGYRSARRPSPPPRRHGDSWGTGEACGAGGPTGEEAGPARSPATRRPSGRRSPGRPPRSALPAAHGTGLHLPRSFPRPARKAPWPRGGRRGRGLVREQSGRAGPCQPFGGTPILASQQALSWLHRDPFPCARPARQLRHPPEPPPLRCGTSLSTLTLHGRRATPRRSGRRQRRTDPPATPTTGRHTPAWSIAPHLSTT